MIYFFIDAECARSAGMTHSARVFGVPAWVSFDDDYLYSSAKFRPFNLWIGFCDWLYDFAAGFIPEENWIEMPVSQIIPIE